MKIYTVVQYEIIEGGVIVTHSESYEYSGPVEECKKGREREGRVGAADEARANTNDAYTAEQRAKAAPTLDSWDKQSNPNGLSNAASAQLADDQNNIANTYKGLRETAYGSLGQRGFGSAPSGFEKSISNGLDVGQENADTGAFRNAQKNTQSLQNQAVNARLGQANFGTQAAQSADNGASESAQAENKMGSTAGDVLGAIAQIAPIAAAPFTGGASLGLMNAKANPFANLGKGAGSGVGGYSPGSSAIGSGGS